MKFSKTVSLLVVVMSVIGCSEPSGTAPITKDKGVTKESVPTEIATKESIKKEAHSHGTGPNGGVVFDLGKYHAEFTVDHNKKECMVLVLSGDEKGAKPTPVAAKEFDLTTKETKTKDGKVVPPMTIKMLPKDEAGGKASKFVGADAGLGNVADFEGTVLGEIDGKPSQGEFKE